MQETELNQKLCEAVKNRNITAVERALGKGANPDTMDADENTMLMLAISLEDKDIALSLIEYGASTEEKDINGYTPIISASISGCTDIVHALIDKNVDLDTQDEDGYTSLHFAAINGHSEIVNALVNARANTDIQTNEDGYTPLTFAILSNYEDIVDTIIEGDADIDIVDYHDFTALDMAIANDQQNIIRMLIIAGACTENIDNETKEKYEREIKEANGEYYTPYKVVNEQTVVKHEGDISQDKELYKVFNFKSKTIMSLVNDEPVETKSFAEATEAKDEILQAHKWMCEQGYTPDSPPVYMRTVVINKNKKNL